MADLAPSGLERPGAGIFEDPDESEGELLDVEPRLPVALALDPPRQQFKRGEKVFRIVRPADGPCQRPLRALVAGLHHDQQQVDRQETRTVHRTERPQAALEQQPTTVVKQPEVEVAIRQKERRLWCWLHGENLPKSIADLERLEQPRKSSHSSVANAVGCHPMGHLFGCAAAPMRLAMPRLRLHRQGSIGTRIAGPSLLGLPPDASSSPGSQTCGEAFQPLAV